MTSRETYVEVVRAVDGWPAWTHAAIELISEGGLILLLVAAVATAYRRGLPAAATAAVGLAATAGAYAVSAALKLAETQARPCQAMPALDTLAACPPAGDWSLPSNHAVIAAALAVAVTAVAPRMAPAAVLVALLVGGSRVALGVHYPHDILTGLLLGAGVAALAIQVLRGPATRFLEALGAALSARPSPRWHR